MGYASGLFISSLFAYRFRLSTPAYSWQMRYLKQKKNTNFCLISLAAKEVKNPFLYKNRSQKIKNINQDIFIL